MIISYKVTFDTGETKEFRTEFPGHLEEQVAEYCRTHDCLITELQELE